MCEIKQATWQPVKLNVEDKVGTYHFCLLLLSQ